MKGVQCYELFGGIALKNHTFSFSFFFFITINLIIVGVVIVIVDVSDDVTFIHGCDVGLSGL